MYEEALRLPDESKAMLAERIVEYLVTHVSPDLELLQLDIVKRRRDEVREKKVAPVDGPGALAMARRIISK
ncbi:MAG: addiction module protein [Pseudomonadota bacterium]